MTSSSEDEDFEKNNDDPKNISNSSDNEQINTENATASPNLQSQNDSESGKLNVFNTF